MRELFYQLYAKTVVLLTYIVIELILVIIGYLKSDTHPVTTTQYLKFIEEKNPTICYTRRLRLRPDHVECRVCLSEFEEGEKVRNLECKHTFHKDCLDKWLHQYCATTCPLCRNKVLPDDVVVKYRLLQNQVEYDGIDDHQLISLLSALRDGSTFYRYL